MLASPGRATRWALPTPPTHCSHARCSHAHGKGRGSDGVATRRGGAVTAHVQRCGCTCAIASKVVTPSKAGHAPPPARDHGTTAAVRSMHHAMQPYYAVGNDAADGNAGAACQPAWREKCVRDRVRERVPPQERTGREPMTSARDTSRPEPCIVAAGRTTAVVTRNRRWLQPLQQCARGSGHAGCGCQCGAPPTGHPTAGGGLRVRCVRPVQGRTRARPPATHTTQEIK